MDSELLLKFIGYSRLPFGNAAYMQLRFYALLDNLCRDSCIQLRKDVFLMQFNNSFSPSSVDWWWK